MLSANVGFLAVPGVILSNLNGSNVTSAKQVVIFTSPAQIASCVSIVTSVGGLVVALLLIREYRLRLEEDTQSNVSETQIHLICLIPRKHQLTHLKTVSYRIFGFEPIAIVFSLPWALLLWSYVFAFYETLPPAQLNGIRLP
jgi:hypothetical protein